MNSAARIYFRYWVWPIYEKYDKQKLIELSGSLVQNFLTFNLNQNIIFEFNSVKKQILVLFIALMRSSLCESIHNLYYFLQYFWAVIPQILGPLLSTETIVQLSRRTLEIFCMLSFYKIDFLRLRIQAK